MRKGIGGTNLWRGRLNADRAAFFYSNERGEPPHIHVRSGDFEAKFWLHDEEGAQLRFEFEAEIKRLEAA